jgi:AAA family ATP:ADP antiporter
VAVFKSLVLKFVSARDDELAPMFWATAYGFAIQFSYYILRAIRDEISTADRPNLQLLWTAVFLVMLVAVPAYSWLTARFQRGVFIPIANRFFILNLVLFYLALKLLPESARPWIDRAFYVWVSVFVLMVVTVFWGFMADLFRNEQGRRLFGFIAVGSTIGGLGGSGLTAWLVQHLPEFSLLLLACIPLEGASWIVALLNRRFGGGDAARPASQPLGGSAWSGIRVVFGSPYLLAIAGYIALMTFASTVMYFLQADLVRAAMSDRAARTAFLARMDFWANGLTIGLQVYLAARIIKHLGVGFCLAILPLIAGLGFVWLGIMPVLWVLMIQQIVDRGVRYGLAKPAREVLWTVVSREEKYKSKAFLDAAVYRGGDLVSGWIYAGLAAAGLAAGAIALTAAPLALLWAAVGLSLGRKQEVRAREQTPAVSSHQAAPA